MFDSLPVVIIFNSLITRAPSSLVSSFGCFHKHIWNAAVALARALYALLSMHIFFFLNVWFVLSKVAIALALVFNFTVLLFYRAIHVFLVQKFNCPIATHGHATYLDKRRELGEEYAMHL